MIYTEADHIQEMIAAGKAKPLPLSISRDFEQYIESCPLSTQSIDWSQLPSHSAVVWDETPEAELVEWARTLRIGRCSHIAMWYTSDEPCLMAGFEFGFANLDTLTWKAAGTRYVFGVDLVDGDYQCAFDAFVEVTGGRLLHGTV